MRFDSVYRRLGDNLPLKYRALLQDRLNKSGSSEESSHWLGSRLLLSVGFGILAAVVPLILYFVGFSFPLLDFSQLSPLLLAVLMLLAFVVGMAVALFVLYLFVYYSIVSRTEQVEKTLPEFLLMIAANLRAGMTPFNAFKRSATSELGPLEREVQLAAVKAGSSQSLTEALSSLSQRIDSDILERTIQLFEKSVRSGGQLAELLTAISEEVRRNQELKTELVTSTKSYTLFLFFIILIVSPGLLAVSAQFLDIYSNIKGQFHGDTIEGYSLPFFAGDIVINTDFASMIAYFSLIGTAFFASVLMGVISRGRLLYGMKYFPLLAIGSVIAFRIARAITSGIFSGL